MILAQRNHNVYITLIYITVYVMFAFTVIIFTSQSAFQKIMINPLLISIGILLLPQFVWVVDVYVQCNLN